jgi:hypothetical protein
MAVCASDWAIFPVTVVCTILVSPARVTGITSAVILGERCLTFFAFGHITIYDQRALICLVCDVINYISDERVLIDYPATICGVYDPVIYSDKNNIYMILLVLYLLFFFMHRVCAVFVNRNK